MELIHAKDFGNVAWKPQEFTSFVEISAFQLPAAITHCLMT